MTRERVRIAVESRFRLRDRLNVILIYPTIAIHISESAKIKPWIHKKLLTRRQRVEDNIDIVYAAAGGKVDDGIGKGIIRGITAFVPTATASSLSQPCVSPL